MANPTYQYEPGSGLQRDQIRLLIPDRVNKQRTIPAVFSDQEIADFMNITGSVLDAAAMACEVIAMDEAKRAISVSISSGMSIGRGSIPGFWLSRAKQLREMSSKIPWEFVDSVSYQIDGYGQDRSNYIGDEFDE
jgi:hypothetical protein